MIVRLSIRNLRGTYTMSISINRQNIQQKHSNRALNHRHRHRHTNTHTHTHTLLMRFNVHLLKKLRKRVNAHSKSISCNKSNKIFLFPTFKRRRSFAVSFFRDRFNEESKFGKFDASESGERDCCCVGVRARPCCDRSIFFSIRKFNKFLCRLMRAIFITKLKKKWISRR
jgi:hypothetical protein